MVHPTTRRAFAAAPLICLLAGALSAQQRQTRPPVPTPPTPPAPSRAQSALGVIDGTVMDTNLVPIELAEVSILRTTLRVRTGANGRFRFVKVPDGAYILIVRRLGFRPTSAVVQVTPPDTLRLAYTLERIAAGLDTVRIVERRQSMRLMEFDYRRALGIGEFLTREQMDRRASLEVKDLLRTFKSLNIAPSYSKGSIAEYFALSRRGGGALQGECAMTVLLDGMLLPTPFNLSLLPAPRELSGIEVYGGPATIPPQFSGYNRGCGMILVWTRDGY